VEDLDPPTPIDYPCSDRRPDTLFVATFFVMAPRAPGRGARLAEGNGVRKATLRDYVNHALNESNEERGNAEEEKNGLCRWPDRLRTPSTVSRSRLYVADYVLMEYGTGAIMAVARA